MQPNGKPQWITVGAGAKPRPCKGLSLGGSCCAMVYPGINPKDGQWTAVECDVPGGKRPSEAKIKGQRDLFAGEAPVFDGKGIRHNPRCADRELIIREIQERERTDVPARKRA